MDRFRLSQSMLKDWENMCGIAFKVKHFSDIPEEQNPFYIGNKDVIILGNVYEQKIIGISRGGKQTVPPADLIKKPVYERMIEQSKLTKYWLRKLDGKIIGVQERIEAEFEWEGKTIYIVGHLDVNFKTGEGKFKIIDLKLSGDRDANYGPFQWKNLNTIDYTQPKHYILLEHLVTKQPIEETEFEYHIADTSTQKRVKIINVTAFDSTIEEHKYRLAKAYNEIEEALTIDYFEPKNDYDRCSVCPLNEDCSYRNIKPIIEYITI